MRNYTRQIPPAAIIRPGFDSVTGFFLPPEGWSGYSGISGYSGSSGYSGYSGHGVANMNASIHVVSADIGAAAFLRLRVVFAPTNPTPAVVFLAPFYKSGISNWSIQPVGSGDAVSAVTSSLADSSDIAADLSNINDLSWNTEIIPAGQNKRFFVTGPVTMLKVTGTGMCYILGA
jgi:hypothetical protein